jgi:HEAT repeat protein
MIKIMLPLVLIVIAGSAHAAIPKVDIEKEIFSSQQSLEVRWKLYHDHILNKPKSAQAMADKAVKSKDWFLREAGLKTLMAINPEKAKASARYILKNDPSMLVRASAVTALKILKDTTSEDLLWESLEDPKNFRKEQSLWIRPQIMATLMEFKSQNKEKYKNYFSDKDPQVVRLAKFAVQ